MTKPDCGDLWERKYVMLALDRYADFVADDPAPAVESLKRQADAILREIGPGEGQTDIRKLGWSLNHIESATLLEPMMRLYNRTHDGRYLDFAKYIVDRFGTNLETTPSKDGYFRVTVEVSLSPTFYAWVFQFGGAIKILTPEKAVNEITEMAKRLAERE